MTQPIIHDQQSDHPAVRSYVDILRRNLPDATYLDGRATALIAGIAAIPHQTDAELRQSLTAVLTALELVRDLLRHPAPVHFLEPGLDGDDGDLMSCGQRFGDAVKTGSYTGVAAKVTCPGCRPTADVWADTSCPTCGSGEREIRLMTGCGFKCDDPSRWHVADVHAQGGQ